MHTALDDRNTQHAQNSRTFYSQSRHTRNAREQKQPIKRNSPRPEDSDLSDIQKAQTSSPDSSDIGSFACEKCERNFKEKDEYDLHISYFHQFNNFQ